MKPTEICKNCRFWKQLESELGAAVSQGECHRNPAPAVHWPTSAPEDFCGEFEQEQDGKLPLGVTSLPEVAQDAPDLDHLIYAAMRLSELRCLGVEAMSPNDPAIALSGGNDLAAVEEAKKLVTNHIAFYRGRLEKLSKPPTKPTSKPVETPAQPELGAIAPEPPKPACDDADAKAKARVISESNAEAEKAMKKAKSKALADEAKAKQAELAAKLQRAEEMGFKW